MYNVVFETLDENEAPCNNHSIGIHEAYERYVGR
jgi:hypothetical protein